MRAIIPAALLLSLMSGVAWTQPTPGGAKTTFTGGVITGATTLSAAGTALTVNNISSFGSYQLFTGTSAGPAASTWIGRLGSGQLALNAPTGQTIALFINNSSVASFSPTSATFNGGFSATGGTMSGNLTFSAGQLILPADTGTITMGSDLNMVGGCAPQILQTGTNGNWLVSVDSGTASLGPSCSDFVYVVKGTSLANGWHGGPNTVEDFAYVSNQQDGTAAIAAVAAGSGYNIGDRITLLCPACIVAPTVVVASLTAGAGSGVATVTPYALGGYGRTIVDSAGPLQQDTTTGGGTGATFTPTWSSNIASVTEGQSSSAGGAVGAITAGATTYIHTILANSKRPQYGDLNLRAGSGQTGPLLGLTAFGGASLGGIDVAGNATFVALALSGIPTSAGSGGLYICVDSTGATYKKSACP